MISTSGHLGFSLVLLTAQGCLQPYSMAYSLPYNALHGGTARGCGYAASRGKVHMHEHEQQLTNTHIRCIVYTLPSNS